MAIFLNVSIGETKSDDGLRLTVREDGEAAWFHGKWLDLAQDHAVAWIDGHPTFEKPDGTVLLMGDFPAWVARSKRRNGACAIMFSAGQFSGGTLIIKDARGRKKRFPIKRISA